jgi:hypothetical protein
VCWIVEPLAKVDAKRLWRAVRQTVAQLGIPKSRKSMILQSKFINPREMKSFVGSSYVPPNGFMKLFQTV